MMSPEHATLPYTATRVSKILGALAPRKHDTRVSPCLSTTTRIATKGKCQLIARITHVSLSTPTAATVEWRFPETTRITGDSQRWPARAPFGLLFFPWPAVSDPVATRGDVPLPRLAPASGPEGRGPLARKLGAR